MSKSTVTGRTLKIGGKANVAAAPIAVLPTQAATKEVSLASFGITSTQESQLMALTFGGVKLSSPSMKNMMYEIIGMIKTLGFEKTYDYLKTVETNNVKTVVFGSPLFQEQRERHQINTELKRGKFEVSKGAEKCKRCGSQNVFSVSQQRRSSDEPETTFYSCLGCGNAWKSG